jgi:filamentous hemagglutinin family protein
MLKFVLGQQVLQLAGGIACNAWKAVGIDSVSTQHSGEFRMVIRGRSSMDGRTVGRDETSFTHFAHFKLAPVARAFAFTLAAGGMIGSAHAVQPFSPAWFANKSAIQATAAITGLMPNGTPVSSLSPQGQQQAANAQLQKSIDNLAQAARGIAWQQGLQAAQRQKVLGDPSNVPNGLGVGGLDTGSLASSWVNANAPTQSTDANGKTVVDIQQTADKAIANWQTFNVGRNTIVQFDQASADWAILNRITDPAMAPSEIQGQIRAPGTVLIVNQNGIVFSGTSQINTRNLVAAAANITDLQFQTGGIYGPDQATPSFTNANGNLIVEEGAQITTGAPTSATQGGGYVLLMGQQVSNAGDIETPQGQIEMAAGDNFIIRQGVGTDGNQSSTTRGNEISPQFNVGSTAGQVINTLTGLLLSTEGDITLAGHDVQQNGVAVATTTVNTRGTIHLLNSASDTTGSVTLGDGAITAVAIEDDGSTALDSQRSAEITASATQDLLRASAASGLFDNLSKLTDLEDESRIEIVTGGSVNFEGGSLTLATGGQIAVSAVNRTFVADGAILDVSGQVGVNLAMSSNDVVVNVQGNELRDSPGNRDSGDLFNTNIAVDRRDLVEVKGGTGPGDDPDDRWYTANGLLEVSGYLDTQGHTIGEWAAQGGTIQLGGNEVVTQTGSQINLSGGSLNVATGYVAQTWLVGSDGQLYNANSAPANMTFTGIYKGFEVAHARWGADAAEFFYNPLIAPKQILENGYTVGRDAGSLIVNAPTAVLEGDILATVYNGPQQDRARDDADGYDQAQTAVAKSGTLTFGQYGPGGLIGVNNTDIQIGNIADVTDGMADDAALSPERIGTTWLDAAHLNLAGLGELDLGTQGNVAINAPLVLANGGALNILAPNVDFNADVTARAGSIDVSNILTRGNGVLVGALLDNGTSGVTVEQGATLDLRGVWSNALLSGSDDLSDLVFLNGGTLSLANTNGVTLSAGAVIDVSSGGAILGNGKIQGGRGGDVALIADQPSAGLTATGTLTLDGSIRAVGFNGGGALKLAAGEVLIADAGTPPASGTLLLTPDFFSTGFSSYDIDGYNGLTVADGVVIDVTMPVYRANGNSRDVPSGADPAAAFDTWTPPLYLDNPSQDTTTQRAGASLALRSSAFTGTGAGVDIGAGALVSVDPGQSIRLDTANQLTVDGTLRAPGGAIVLANDSKSDDAPQGTFIPGLSIWIGGDAVLDVAGASHAASGLDGLRYGSASDGGSIIIGSDNDPATDAMIVIRPGALLDASGASVALDVETNTNTNAGAGAHHIGTVIDAGNGGSIALSSYNGIYVDGVLRAAAGGGAGSGAAGGTLSVTLATTTPPEVGGAAVPDAQRVARAITISQDSSSSGLAANLAPGQDDPTLAVGNARLGADQIEAGGFDNVSLDARDMFVFDGPVALKVGGSISLFHGALTSADAAGAVTLEAPHVVISGVGLADASAYINNLLNTNLSSQSTAATLTIVSDLVDFSNTVRFGVNGSIIMSDNSVVTVDGAGFDAVNVISSGDVRFGVNAIVLTGNDLSFAAAQLYPVTGAVASVAAGANGTLNITRNGTAGLPPLPDSVFGSLTLAGGTVNQDGIVRAPLGALSLNAAGALTLGPDSVTSVSAAGLTLPYGGTTDGINYLYDGVVAIFPNGGQDSRIEQGISLNGQTIAAEQGAVVDLSGGGQLLGAGFVSGRGGSVDILTTALINANPANTFSAAGDPVYAIVPGYEGGYAPVDPGAGAAPGAGQQITVAAGVPGLPAGTYTLLPARYALLPGAYRVEIGKQGTIASPPVATGNGSYVASGYQSTVNTDVRSALPNQIILTAGTAVRDYSSYNETSYSDFAVANAQTLGQPVPIIPADAKTLGLYFQPGAAPGTAFSYDATTLFAPAAGGRGGTATVDFGFGLGGDMEIVAATPTAGFNGISLRAQDLDNLGAAQLVIGGVPFFDTLDAQPSTIIFKSATNSVSVRDGAVLTAPEVFLVAGRGLGQDAAIDVEEGAQIDTIGAGTVPYDSSDGYIYYNAGLAIVAVSNGRLDFEPAQALSAGAISIGAAPASGSASGPTRLLSEGTIDFVTDTTAQFAADVLYGTRNLAFTVANVNIGTDAALAAANVPTGLLLTQSLLDQLLSGASAPGAPKLEQLTLTGGAINFFGSVDLSTIDPVTGVSSLKELDLNTPGIYGYGSATDTATLSTGTIVWNGAASGNASIAPGTVLVNGPGTGSGALTINADRIVLGYAANTKVNSLASLDRLLLGFGTVNLVANDEIVTANKGTLSVYQSQGNYVAGSGYAYSGGNLNLIAPLIAGGAGSVVGITAGGALTLGTTGGAAAPVGSDTLGGELDLKGATISVDTTIALPSGRLTMTADGDIDLNGNSRLDLAGRSVALADDLEYSWGGDVILTSNAGNITQQAGASIDISAINNAGGSVTAEALGASAGQVALNGTIAGSASGDYMEAGGDVLPFLGGSLTVRAQSLSDFAGLNARLNDGGVNDERSFDIKQGNLLIGDEVQAHAVTISVDGGSLTVNGTIDASGAQAGAIRLSSRDDLTLAADSKLDAHGTVLRVDSYGQVIDASNQGTVELGSSQGWLRLDSGATIDVRSADGVNRGDIALDAQRLVSATAGDVAIAAAGPLDIQGAGSIAVNAFWTYTDAPVDPDPTVSGRPDQLITQAYLDQINTNDSLPFMANALGNADLLGRMAGLSHYSDAFHFRPGVDISSATTNGDLTVQGDLDFSGYRYTSLNPNSQQTGVYGSGEPGSIVFRAGGNLNVYGSITDGFGKPVATPDDDGWVLMPPTWQFGVIQNFEVFGFNVLVPQSVTLAAFSPITGTSTTFGTSALNFAVPLTENQTQSNVVIPVDITLSQPYTFSRNWLATSTIHTAAGVTYVKGQTVPAGTLLDVGSTLAAGSVMPDSVWTQPMTVPAGIPLNFFENPAVLAQDTVLPAGAVLPVGTLVAGFAIPPDANGNTIVPSVPTRPIDSGTGVQGQNWAVAPMLAPGSLSWSMRLVAGADLGAADTRTLRSKSDLAAADASGNIGNLILGDQHYTAQLFNFDGTTYTNPNMDQNIGDGIPFDLPNNYLDYIASPDFSVIRTGTGNLELLAGGDYVQHSLYGVYTAGTQAAAIGPQYQLQRGAYTDNGGIPDGTILGAQFSDPAFPNQDYAGTLADEAAYYTQGGGNVLLSVQGNISQANMASSNLSDNYFETIPASNDVSNWLWRQGGSGNGQATSWWINFGAYIQPQTTSGTLNGLFSIPQLVGFEGIGALGGGNVTILAGGNSGALNVADASTGRVTAVTTDGNTITGGTLALTGGGDVTLKIGGTLAGGATSALTNMRGELNVDAQSVGNIELVYTQDAADPRAVNPLAAGEASSTNGLILMLGDAIANVRTDGDLVLTGAGDPGSVDQSVQNGYDFQGFTSQSGGMSWFSLWTARTAVNLFSAGGNLTPSTLFIGTDGPLLDNGGNLGSVTGVFYAPPTLRAIAADGNLFYGSFVPGGASRANVLELAPSPVGQLDLIAAQSIFANGAIIDMSGADAGPDALPNPFRPGFYANVQGVGAISNANDTVFPAGFAPDIGTPFLFENDTPTSTLHADDPNPIRIYAAAGDIVDLQTGDITAGQSNGIFYRAAKPVDLFAGGDIVASGGVMLNDSDTDISTISAGRDILYANFKIAGPGLLVVSAGRNFYQADRGILESVGSIVGSAAQGNSAGAGITVMAGVGAAGPDYAGFDDIYLNPANAPALTGGSAIVSQNDDMLYAWLQQRLAYAGAPGAAAYAYFLALPAAQQGVFARQIYFDELTDGGREFNDPTSVRYQSYLRGRDAIAALFPSTDSQGDALVYDGNVTMFGGSGIHTDFGGGIDVLTPGGTTLIGVEGQTPPPTAGLITQGAGDIDIYSQGSVLLGLSRIMTTFGGDILAWSATGDINAGRGAKTTVLFTPPKRVYDDVGDITLAPQAPSSGAGIATLAPIPEVPAGDVDLIAPLGTIDAGEAGIRVSGNVNLAALQVVDAANIEVKGKSTGLPLVASVNVSALTNASAAASQAAIAAQDVVQRERAAARQALPSIFTVRVLGFGNDAAGGDTAAPSSAPGLQSRGLPYDPASPVQLIGVGGDFDAGQVARLNNRQKHRLQDGAD